MTIIRHCLINLLLLLGLNSYSQTVKETEDWLKYTLNKFCNSTFDYNQSSVREKYLNWTKYSWSRFDYDFPKEGVLRITETGYRKTDGHIDSLCRKIVTNINLKRIIRLDKEVKLDSTSIYDYRLASINIEFSQPNYDSSYNLLEQSATVYNALSSTQETEAGQYLLNMRIGQTLSQEALRGDILDRIIKALEHLVDLLHGKILKDIF